MENNLCNLPEQPKQKEMILNTKMCAILSNGNYFRLSECGRCVISHKKFTQLIVCVIRNILGRMRDNRLGILVSHTLLPSETVCEYGIFLAQQV
jgi:hypothetical protein